MRILLGLPKVETHKLKNRIKDCYKAAALVNKLRDLDRKYLLYLEGKFLLYNSCFNTLLLLSKEFR